MRLILSLLAWLVIIKIYILLAAFVEIKNTQSDYAVSSSQDYTKGLCQRPGRCD